MNTLTQKILVATIALSTTLGAASLPSFASAHNGLYLGTQVKAGNNAQVKFDNDDHFNIGGLGINMGSSVSASTQAAFKQAIKDANTNYKTAKKSAQVQLKASINASTSQTDRTAAIKAYFSSLLTALKARSAAIEAAFQAFINAM